MSKKTFLLADLIALFALGTHASYGNDHWHHLQISEKANLQLQIKII